MSENSSERPAPTKEKVLVSDKELAKQNAELYGQFVTESAPTAQPFAPTKEDCRMLDAIMKAAKQIHAEFDCLSDHVMTGKQIREQVYSSDLLGMPKRFARNSA